MKAIQLERPEHFHIIDVPEPDAPKAGDVVVRVHRVGICGTDYSGYLGKMPFFSYPRIPGHELGVEVVSVGEGVTNVKPGDHCAVEPYMTCGTCYSCTRGHSNCCETLQTLGVHTDGGLRPLFTVPARKLHISRKLTMEQLALVETLAIGCHAINRGKPTAEESVLVIGAGPIGLSVIEFAKIAGARTIVMDTNAQRLEFVRDQMGIPDTILTSGDGEELKALQKLTDNRLANVVIDATGNNVSMSKSLEYVGFAGRLVFVGITTKEVTFLHPLMHRREMTLLASRNALPGDFTRIISLIEEGKIDTKPWITHHVAMNDVPAEFARFLKPETRVVKAIVEMPA